MPFCFLNRAVSTIVQLVVNGSDVCHCMNTVMRSLRRAGFLNDHSESSTRNWGQNMLESTQFTLIDWVECYVSQRAF